MGKLEPPSPPGRIFVDGFWGRNETDDSRLLQERYSELLAEWNSKSPEQQLIDMAELQTLTTLAQRS